MLHARNLVPGFLACAGLFAAVPAAPALAQGKTMAQDDWVQTSAIQWGAGVRVASGDVDGSPAAGDEHEVEYTVVAGQGPPPPRGSGAIASSGKPGTAKEMDNASPKLAQFAINGNSPGPCRVGSRFPSLRLDDGRDRWRLSGVAVVGCGAGGMTVSYQSRTAVR